jgi:D-3-phosphoglycerate dehydrogenase / 2-oxoglutarate reductase
MNEKINLLINLPAGFFTHAQLTPLFDELRDWANVETASCNSGDEILPLLRDKDAVLMWSWPLLTDAILDECPRLKFSANIDISQSGARTLLGRGIAVSVSRRGFSPAVSEMALLLILECLRRTPDYHQTMREGCEEWVKAFPDDIDTRERQLTGRRVGIIGLGGVGGRLRELLAPFACEVSVYDPYLSDEKAAAQNVTNLELNDLMRESEIVIVCAASNDGTKHLIGAEEINLLPRDAVFINVARAALVDYEALAQRLQRGDLIAALDVFETEPLPADSPLRGLPNLYLTPHRAGGLMESVERILQYLIDDLKAHFSGAERRYALTEAMIPSLDA